MTTSDHEGYGKPLTQGGHLEGTPEGIHVYPVENGYVVADGGGWIDGHFDTAGSS